MKRIRLIISILLCAVWVHGQVITIDLPQHPGKTIDLSFKQGVSHKLILTAQLDARGKVRIIVPRQYKGFKGMGSFRLQNGEGIDFIINGESPTIFCDEEYPHSGNIVFYNSPENQALQRWFISQAERQQKMAIMRDAEYLYNTDHGFYYLAKDEKQELLTEQSDFEHKLKQSPLYAARFMEAYNFLNTRVSCLLFADSLQLAQTRTFVRDSLDLESLYTSGLWFDTLSGLLPLYDNQSPYHNDFVGDISVLLARSTHADSYTTLAENLLAILLPGRFAGLHDFMDNKNTTH